MNPSQFFNSAVSAVPAIQGLTNVTPKNQVIYGMKVDETEMRIMIADIMHHLNMQPRPGVRIEAENILQYVTQQEALQIANQKYMERHHAYMSGGLMEKLRRAIGGHPIPPGMQMQMPQPLYPAQPMYQQPQYPQQQQIGYHQQPMPQAPMQPQQQVPQGQGQEPNQMEQMQSQINQLTEAVTALLQNNGGSQQRGE